MAILTAVTANVPAFEPKMGWAPVRAAERLATLCRAISLMAGIGLDAHIVYHVNGPLKSQAGKLAYWIAGTSLLGKRLPQICAEAGGRKYICSFALLSKVKNYGSDFELPRK